MKIIGLDACLPSRCVTNDDVLALVQTLSQDEFEGDLTHTLKVIKRLLDKTGINTRYWLGPDEVPMELMERSFNKAVEQAGIHKSEIDLLIFTGVARGCTAPGNAVWVAQSLGLNCQAFDVLDACMGWVSSLEIVNELMNAGIVKYAAVINFELNIAGQGENFKEFFKINRIEEIEYKFSRYTIGEAVVVTILNNQDIDNFKFFFISRPSAGNFCTISLPFANMFGGEEIDANDYYQFRSFSRKMDVISNIEAVNVIKSAGFDYKNSSLLVSHTFSESHFTRWTHEIDMVDIYYSVIAKTGNIVSSSIPLGLSWALQENKIEKGNECVGWAGGAGMVFGTVKFCI